MSLQAWKCATLCSNIQLCEVKTNNLLDTFKSSYPNWTQYEEGEDKHLDCLHSNRFKFILQLIALCILQAYNIMLTKKSLKEVKTGTSCIMYLFRSINVQNVMQHTCIAIRVKISNALCDVALSSRKYATKVLSDKCLCRNENMQLCRRASSNAESQSETARHIQIGLSLLHAGGWRQTFGLHCEECGQYFLALFWNGKDGCKWWSQISRRSSITVKAFLW